jgi:hypothetical protein
MSALLVFPFPAAHAQQQQDVQVWLTTVGRKALLAPQGTPLHFAATATAD